MMRKILFALSLTGFSVLAGASDALAQIRSGYSPGISIGYGRGGYNSPYGYNGYRGYNSNYQGYGYGYSPSYYYSTPSYTIVPAVQMPTTEIRQSYYSAPATSQQTARMTVLVPVADTQLWLENVPMTAQGMNRVFQSPPLDPNQHFTYTVKAQWTENGQVVNRERRVAVQAGQNVSVNFRDNFPASAPSPLLQLPNSLPR